MASNSNLPPNSRMIVDLLMKNAAKYNDEEHVGGDDTISLQKQKLPINDREKKKEKEAKKRKPLKNDSKGKAYEIELKTKIKMEPGKEIKIEYTEVKTETLDSELIKVKENKENFKTDNIFPLKNKSNSIIFDLLKKNIAKYEETNTVTYQKENHSNIKRTNGFNDSKEKKFKQEQNNHPENKYSIKKEYEEVEFEHKQVGLIKTELWDSKSIGVKLKAEDGGHESYEVKEPKTDNIENVFPNDSFKASYDSKRNPEISSRKSTKSIPTHITTKKEEYTPELEVADIESKKDTSKKLRVRKTGTEMKKWTQDEDKVLLEAMDKFGEMINFKILSQKLYRHDASVRSRVYSLKDKRLIGYHQFTLAEDQFLIDTALEQLPFEPLDQIRLKNPPLLGAQLGRTGGSCSQRWSMQLNPWLLQHFSGTLNLDTRRMLANYLAENFQDADSVDWISVARKPKFAGHSAVSLRYIFFKQLYRDTKRMHDARKVTLDSVAAYTNAKYKDGECRRVDHKTLKRQQDVIEYFEKNIKKQGMGNFKLYNS